MSKCSRSQAGFYQRPAVGLPVHYVSYGSLGGDYPSVCRAAVITEVVNDVDASVVHLCVLNPEGLYFNAHVEEDGITFLGGTWHWPERV